MMFLNIAVSLALFSLVNCDLPPVCDDGIFCQGNLLHTVQMSRIFKDSKTFVDMKLKYDRAETLEKFDELMDETKGHPNRSQIERFVEQHFDKPGSELEDWVPTDWKEHPKILDKMVNEDAKKWMEDLNGLWKVLGRKMKNDVKLNPDRYSIFHVPNPVIIPGGRFREFYYWDSYWIVLGLLHSEMPDTVKGMLSNFVSMIDTIGFVPNGGRKYYSMRSQPPLLIPMVKLYMDFTGDHHFVRQNVDKLEKEFHFWMSNRTVTIEKGSHKYILARYADSSSGPRPESYYEDVTVAAIFPTENKKQEFYSQIKSGAESGWDFSSRWFLRNDGSAGELKDIRTKSIVPVDLNSIICWNAEILSEFFEMMNDHKKALIYSRLAQKWKKAINKVLWNEKEGIWLDYNLDDDSQRNLFFASNLFPLWTKCYDESRNDIAEKVLKYLNRNNINGFKGGIPSSLVETGQQWDAPNAWPHIQYAIIKGLESSEDRCAKLYARNLAVKWVQSNFQAYQQTRAMYEKYDATVFGKRGGGGEYEVQLGFGWSNGVIMDLLLKFPDALTADQVSYNECSHLSSDSSNTFALNYVIFILTLPILRVLS